MRCVLETAPDKTPLMLHNQIEKNKDLLCRVMQRYTKRCNDQVVAAHPLGDGSRPLRVACPARRVAVQVAAIYELQAFCHRKGSPPGLFGRLMNYMQMHTKLEYDAFKIWRADMTDDTPGKALALAETASWHSLSSDDDDEED